MRKFFILFIAMLTLAYSIFKFVNYAQNINIF